MPFLLDWLAPAANAHFPADCVEKHQISGIVIFRKEPAIQKSQMRSAMRRSELADERQMASLAEPLA